MSGHRCAACRGLRRRSRWPPLRVQSVRPRALGPNARDRGPPRGSTGAGRSHGRAGARCRVRRAAPGRLRHSRARHGDADRRRQRIDDRGHQHIRGGSTDSDADLHRAQLAAIVVSSDDAIVSKTLDGIITSWNIGAERVFGYSAEEAIGKHISLIIPPDRMDEETDVLARLRRGEKIDHFETVRATKDGRLVDISLTGLADQGQRRPHRRRVEGGARHHRAAAGGRGAVSQPAPLSADLRVAQAYRSGTRISRRSGRGSTSCAPPACVISPRISGNVRRRSIATSAWCASLT